MFLQPTGSGCFLGCDKILLRPVYRQKKNQSLDFPDPFQARRLPIVSAKSDFVSCRHRLCPAKKVRVDAEKTLDLKLQTWAMYSSYVGQVRVRVRVKVRVNTKKQKIRTC